jgi:hypothetical protein
MSKSTPGPWFVSGVRFRMNGSEWIAVNRYNEALKRDDNVACIGYDPRTGDGQVDARLIAAAPTMLEALELIADFPSASGNRDMTFSEAVSEMAHIAFAAIAAAKGETP